MKEKSSQKKYLHGIILGVLLILLVITVLRWQQPTSPLYLLAVPEGKTGSEVCFEKNMSCVSLTTSRIVDSDDKFYGFSTPSCDSQVIREASCISSHDTEFAINNVVYTRSPNAESDASFSVDYFCMVSEKGKKGTYEYAYCAKK